jgi:FAD/FMN-containing dehydrogenase
MTALQRGLRFNSAEPPVRMTYGQNLFRLEFPKSALNDATSERAYVTMIMPASTVKEFLADVLAMPPQTAALPTAAGVERFGVYALNTASLRRPLFVQPGDEQAFVVWLFRSVRAGDAARLAAVQQSNRRLLDRMSALGGKRYPPYSGIVMSPQDWSAHYGAQLWKRLTQAKQKYDAKHVLSPGTGMFA